MQKMQPLTAILLVFSLGLSLASCNGISDKTISSVNNSTNNSNNGSLDSSSPTPEPSSPYFSSTQLSPDEKIAQDNLLGLISKQFTIYFNQNRFGSTAEELGGLPLSNGSYDYEIASVTPTRVYIIATAKTPDLKSFSAQVFVVPPAERAKVYKNHPVVGSICVTPQPSNVPPPEPVDLTAAEPTCPAGSATTGTITPA